MLHPRFFPLVCKYVTRHRTRSLLTITGVATAMFLFCAVQAMQAGVSAATTETAKETTLIVYRENRYCPFSSNLPQDYAGRIAAISGVRAVVPVKIVVNNCRTGLDVVTFRGVPVEAFERGILHRLRLVDGSLDAWKKRQDAALVGERLAKRRNVKVGDRLDISGLTISVAGIIDSAEPQDQNVAYTHLEFVQRSAGNKAGIVTQFIVEVDDPKRLESVAKAIDDEFRNAQEPTGTWSEKAFVARVITDIIDIVNFARWLGWGCLVGVFALVGNAVFLSVRDRIKDHAVFQTLGYPKGLIARLIVAEGIMLSLLGGTLGVFGSAALTRWNALSFSMEGLSVHVQTGIGSIALGLLFSALIGVIAGLVPAWQASRQEIAACFRAV
jgi:putative ABC transport system permease protein